MNNIISDWKEFCIKNHIDNIELLINFLNNNKIKLSYRFNNNKSLVILYNDWDISIDINKSLNIIDYINNLVIDQDLNIIYHNGKKIFDSIRDNFNYQFIKNKLNIDENIDNQHIDIYESYEGTIINIFYYDKWYYTTKKKFDIFDSYFGSTKSHGDMFNDIISKDELEKYLNTKYKYTFTLVHKDNSHLLNNSNKLILIDVKDENLNKLDDYEHLNKLIESNIIYLQKKINILDFIKNESLDLQGIIIYNDNICYRLYTKRYNELLINNPKFHSIQEELLYKYNKNLLDNNDYYYELTKNIMYYIGLILYKLLYYFTNFHINNELKFSHKNINNYHFIADYKILKHHIYVLQRLSYIKKTDILLKDINYYLKSKCIIKDLWYLYNIFINDNNLLNLIEYDNIKLNEKIKIFNNLNL
jgi:hypothetical protein